MHTIKTLPFAFILIAATQHAEVGAQAKLFNPDSESKLKLEVTAAVADVKAGAEVVARVDRGANYDVQKRQGEWLYISVLDSQNAQRSGWIHQDNVRVFQQSMHSTTVDRQPSRPQEPGSKNIELVVKTGNRDRIGAAEFGQKEPWLLTSGDDTVLWDVDREIQLRTFEGGYGTFGPNDQVVATATRMQADTPRENNFISLWESRTGKLVNRIKSECDIYALKFSPNGKYLAAAGDDCIVRVWEIPSFSIVFSHSIHAKSPENIRSAIEKESPFMKDVILEQLNQEGMDGGWFVNALAFSPDSRTLLSGGRANTVLFNITKQKPVRVITGEARSVRFLSNTEFLTAAGHEIFVWDTDQEQTISKLSLPNIYSHINTMAVTRDGENVVAASYSEDRVYMWQLRSGKIVRAFEDDLFMIGAIDVSPNNKDLVIAHGLDGRAALFDVESALGRGTLGKETAEFNRASVEDNDLFLLSSGGLRCWRNQDQSVHWSFDWFDDPEMAPLWRQIQGGGVIKWEEVRNVSYNVTHWAASKKHVFVVNDKGDLIVLSRSDGQFVSKQHVCDGELTCVSCADNGEFLAVANKEGLVFAYSKGPNAVPQTFSQLKGESIVHLDTDAAGKLILVSDERGNATLINVTDMSFNKIALKANAAKQTGSAAPQTQAVLWAVVTPSGRILSIEENAIVIRDRTLTESRRLNLATTPVRVAIRDDESEIAVQSGKQILFLTGDSLRETDRITIEGDLLGYAKDGTYIVTDTDHGIRFADRRKGSLVAEMYVFWGSGYLVATAEGFFDGTANERNRVFYRVGNGLNVVVVDRFFNDFYYPGLLKTILEAEPPRPIAQLGKNLPPTVSIVSPDKEIETTDGVAELTIEVNDVGGGVLGPWLRHNGSRLTDQPIVLSDANPKKLLYKVSLLSGENRIRVEAASGDGTWESEPAILTLKMLTKLEKPDLYVLAVGVNKYADESMNLRFAVPDVQAMTKVFRERGQALYEKVHVTELTNENATRRRIRTALREMADLARPQDTLLVHLSGHGFTVGQRYYFIPHEFEQESRRFEDDVRDFGFPSDELADAIGEVPALKRVLLLDTCNSGGAIAKSDSRRRNPFAFRGAIERLSRAQGIFTLAASASSEETVEIEQLGHGVLTYSLLAGLSAVSDGPLAGQSLKSEKNSVNVLDWFGYANEQVPLLTKQYLGTAQDVKMSGEGTSFPILPLLAN